MFGGGSGQRHANLTLDFPHDVEYYATFHATLPKMHPSFRIAWQSHNPAQIVESVFITNRGENR